MVWRSATTGCSHPPLHGRRRRCSGEDAYPTLHVRAAALLHSLAFHHPLVDGDERHAWLATYVFLDISGHAPRATQDEVVELVLSVVSGQPTEVEKIAEPLAGW